LEGRGCKPWWRASGRCGSHRPRLVEEEANVGKKKVKDSRWKKIMGCDKL
jgi:hypothetical protein